MIFTRIALVHTWMLKQNENTKDIVVPTLTDSDDLMLTQTNLINCLDEEKVLVELNYQYYLTLP